MPRRKAVVSRSVAVRKSQHTLLLTNESEAQFEKKVRAIMEEMEALRGEEEQLEKSLEDVIGELSAQQVKKDKMMGDLTALVEERNLVKVDTLDAVKSGAMVRAEALFLAHEMHYCRKAIVYQEQYITAFYPAAFQSLSSSCSTPFDQGVAVSEGENSEGSSPPLSLPEEAHKIVEAFKAGVEPPPLDLAHAPKRVVGRPSFNFFRSVGRDLPANSSPEPTVDVPQPVAEFSDATDGPHVAYVAPASVLVPIPAGSSGGDGVGVEAVDSSDAVAMYATQGSTVANSSLARSSHMPPKRQAETQKLARGGKVKVSGRGSAVAPESYARRRVGMHNQRRSFRAARRAVQQTARAQDVSSSSVDSGDMVVVNIPSKSSRKSSRVNTPAESTDDDNDEVEMAGPQDPKSVVAARRP